MPDTVVLKENKLTVLKVDEAVNTTFICEVKNRLGTGKEQVTALVRGGSLPPSSPPLPMHTLPHKHSHAVVLYNCLRVFVRECVSVCQGYLYSTDNPGRGSC
jgi:hypothetical protein